MTLRKSVLPLGFGLSAILGVSAASPDDEPSSSPRPALRVYTNEDLDRVRPFRDQTGVQSVPAVSPGEEPPALPEPGRPVRHGEEYWRRETSRLRDRLRSLEDQAAGIRSQIAEREEEGRLFTRRGRGGSSSRTSEAGLRAKLARLELRMRQMEEDFADRARREGALPGWLR